MKRVILIALVAVLPQIQGCDFDSDGFLGKLFKGGGSAVPVTVEGVTIRDKDYRIKVPATIEPSKVEEITFPKEITVEKVLVSVGDKVSVGDPLFQISEMEIKNRIAKLQEDLRDAKADIDKNMYLFNNRDRLIEEGRIEQSQYDDIEPDLDAAEQVVDDRPRRQPPAGRALAGIGGGEGGQLVGVADLGVGSQDVGFGHRRDLTPGV